MDGILTADPHLVPGARTIAEISYREAADLAHFGAKVLHPKTICPLLQSGIPVWIRNTFSPELPGTRITPAGPVGNSRIKAVTAVRDVALITVDGLSISGLPDVFTRIFATTAAIPAEVLLVFQSPSPNGIRFAVSSALAQPTVDALRREFAKDLADEEMYDITQDLTVAIVAAVGQNLYGDSVSVDRMFSALRRENVDIIAMARGRLDDNISFLISRKDLDSVLLTAHQALQLGGATPQGLSTTGS